MSNLLINKEIEELIRQKPPLIEGYVNLEEQLQPNGIDLTLRGISILKSAGQITTSNSRRILPDSAPVPFDSNHSVHLAAGCYLVTYNEIIHLPPDIAAQAAPRSSLLRSGVTIHCAIWDAGYSGRSQSLLVVYNPLGFRLEQNARILQLVFLRLTEKTQGYRGIYQGENIESPPSGGEQQLGR
jgi:dUTP pyrophosphatase